MTTKQLIPLFGIAAAASANAALLINFSRPGTSSEIGYENYEATHEDNASFVSQSYTPSFALTGAASVAIDVNFPNSTAAAVKQMIARASDAGNWLGAKSGLLNDWIGTDTRAGGGDFDGTTGTPTYIVIELSGLAASPYSLLSYHNDFENMNTNFTVEVSVDGGLTFVPATSGRVTNNRAGGSPAENEVLAGTGVNVAGGDPADLDSSITYGFTATGSDVHLRYTGLSDNATAGVHQAFFAMNGFELTQVPEPSSALLSFVGLGFLARRRR